MEAANKLSRQASEYESDGVWDKAEEAHRQAAEAYRNVDIFGFDPVATLTLTSLANKHVRWAEHCKLEHERQAKSPESVTSAFAEQQDNTSTPAPLDAAAGSDEKEDHEFEEFWRYMQNWLANPTAFTPTSATPTRKDGGNAATWGADVGGTSRNIMESFYLVGANPDQSASIYGTVEATPRTASPLHTLSEADEETLVPPQDITNVLQSIASSARNIGSRHDSVDRTSPKTNTTDGNDALRLENQRLQKLLLHMNERIHTLESAAQENTMLKSSILNFREEFHRHANIGAIPRINKQSPGLRHGALRRSNVNIANSNDEYVRQLEQQVQMLQLENTKQASMQCWC
ncbi:hypothetical protein EV175_005197 [Coemansia sp. RSA 1933]|nr:hypothetical protein EV175_005197 [Coemansia sp. RSA 1933]